MAQIFHSVGSGVIIDINQIVAMVKQSEEVYILHLRGATINVAGEDAKNLWLQLHEAAVKTAEK